MRNWVRLGLMLGLATAVWAQGTASVSGAIVDPTDAIIVGTSVQLTKSGTATRWITQSGVDGTFRFEGLDAGSYELVAEVQVFYASHVAFELGDGESKTLPHIPLFIGTTARCEDVHVQLTPSQGPASRVSGRLLERKGNAKTPKPLAGVEIIVGTTRATTTKDGSFRLQPEGPGTLKIGDRLELALWLESKWDIRLDPIVVPAEAPSSLISCNGEPIAEGLRL